MAEWTRSLSVAAMSWLAACNVGDQIRGNDDDAFFAGGRARFARRARDRADDPSRADRVRYRPTLELGTDYVDGDFPQTGASGEYRVFTLYGAFAPEIAWRALCFTPMIGVGYADATVTSGPLRAAADDLGAYFGIEASVRALDWLQPYARFSGIGSNALDVSQIELGVDLRPTSAAGVQIAWIRRTTEIDLSSASDIARIDSDGLFVGLSLRF